MSAIKRQIVKKRICIDLTVEGSDGQANCVADAIGIALGDFVEEHVNPVAHSEEVNVQWDIFRCKWAPLEESTPRF